MLPRRGSPQSAVAHFASSSSRPTRTIGPPNSRHSSTRRCECVSRSEGPRESRRRPPEGGSRNSSQLTVRIRSGHSTVDYELLKCSVETVRRLRPSLSAQRTSPGGRARPPGAGMHTTSDAPWIRSAGRCAPRPPSARLYSVDTAGRRSLAPAPGCHGPWPMGRRRPRSGGRGDSRRER